jgi:hypothetical protein
MSVLDLASQQPRRPLGRLSRLFSKVSHILTLQSNCKCHRCHRVSTRRRRAFQTFLLGIPSLFSSLISPVSASTRARRKIQGLLPRVCGLCVCVSRLAELQGCVIASSDLALVYTINSTVILHCSQGNSLG